MCLGNVWIFSSGAKNYMVNPEFVSYIRMVDVLVPDKLGKHYTLCGINYITKPFKTQPWGKTRFFENNPVLRD